VAIRLVSVSGGVILRTDNQTTTLLRTTIDRLDDINQLLLILQDPVELVVVTGTEIAHHMFIAEEEHEGNRIVEFIHLLEVGDLVEVADVDDGEVLDTIGDAVEDLILSHAIRIPITTETDDDKSFIFAHDCLVDVPSGNEMGEYNRSHGVCCLGVSMRAVEMVCGCLIVGDLRLRGPCQVPLSQNLAEVSLSLD